MKFALITNLYYANEINKKILIFSIIMKFMVILDLYHSNVLRKNIKIFTTKVKFSNS